MKQGIFIQKARSIFSDNDGVRYIPRQKFGQALDIQRLALADAGETRIFAKAEKRQFCDYQIMFLMDVSGSMSGLKVTIMCQAVHAMAYALTKAGAAVHGMSFNARTEVVDTEDLFDLEVLERKLSHRTSGSKGGGCNHDGSAIAKAVARINAMTSSPAKIVLVFSDGQPACDGEESDDEYYEDCGNEAHDQDLHLKNQIRLARKTSVELLGVGIQTNSVTKYYGKAKSIEIYDLLNLYPLTMKLLERNIRRG